MKRLVAGGVLAALVSGTAAAEAFKVGDLGEMPSRRVCMSTAAEVLETYIKEYGGLSTSGDTGDPEGWSYYAWDLRPGEIDAVITCPVVGDQVNAFYVLHSSGAADTDNTGDTDNADAAAELIRELWNRLY